MTPSAGQEGYPMDPLQDDSLSPLLGRPGSIDASDTSYKSSSPSVPDDVEELDAGIHASRGRSVEDNVIPETAVLGRNLGWSSAYVLIISRVIGSGIFATPGAIVRSVGSVGITLLLWVVGALISWFGLMVTLEYGCMLPQSGGDKVYFEFTYRRPKYLATVLIAVQSILLGFTASNCIVFAEYVLFAFGRPANTTEVKLIGAALLTSIIIMHSCFMRTGILVQNVLGYLKIALVIFMILAGVFAVLFHPADSAAEVTPLTTASTATSAWNSLWQGSVWAWGTIATALFKVFYSYAGLHNVNNVLNEVKNPVKTLKSAASTALWTACLLYLLVNIAYFMVVPMDEIKSSGELIAALFFQRLFGEHVGRIVLPLAVAISAAGNVMVVTFSHARMIQEIARSGVLPSPLPRLLSSTRPFNAPMGALITHYIPSLLVITIPTGNIYSFILDVEGYPGQIFSLATSFGLIWLRFKRPDLRRPYKAFLPAIWLRVLMSVALLAAPFVPRNNVAWRQHFAEVSYAFVGTSIILFGVLYWYVWTRLLPRWYSYDLDRVEETLADGTTINRMVQVPRGFKGAPEE